MTPKFYRLYYYVFHGWFVEYDKGNNDILLVSSRVNNYKISINGWDNDT